jgi:5-methylcytosine-specific restriction endonuclease McrA
MKRSPMSPRKAPIARAPLARGTTPLGRNRTIKPRNAERQAKKRARYQAYINSPEWKAKRRMAIKAAGHQCQRWVTVEGVTWRCRETTHLQVHHVTYSRFGGAELLEDLLVLCKDCHRAHHALEGKRIA